MVTHHIAVEEFDRYGSKFSAHKIKSTSILELLIGYLDLQTDLEGNESAADRLKSIGDLVVIGNRIHAAYYTDEEHTIGIGGSHAEACEMYFKARKETEG